MKIVVQISTRACGTTKRCAAMLCFVRCLMLETRKTDLHLISFSTLILDETMFTTYFSPQRDSSVLSFFSDECFLELSILLYFTKDSCGLSSNRGEFRFRRFRQNKFIVRFSKEVH
jgi:hypothetical protein